MGYTTDFEGRFQLNKPLSEDQAAYLTAFAKTRFTKTHSTPTRALGTCSS